MRLSKRIVAVILAALIALNVAMVFADEIQRVLSTEYSNYQQKFKHVDLRGVVNRGFADEVAGDGIGGWSDQGSVNDMSCFNYKGINNFMGVSFDIIDPNLNNGKSAIMLRGVNDETVPTEVKISVDETCAGVYFLHTAPWGNNQQEEVGSYTLNFEDGSSQSVALRCGTEVFNWWGMSTSDVATCVWNGTNSSSLVSLAVYAVKNESPEKIVRSITCSTTGTGPYLGIVGITLTDYGPYLPYEKNEDIGNPSTEDWYAYQYCDYPELIEGTALDMSHLQDKPAGKHGYIGYDGENLKFEDGTAYQAWGVNVGFTDIYLDKKDIDDSVKRMSQMGFNAVRFHAIMGGERGKLGGTTRVDVATRRTTQISEKYMDQLCYFMAKTKEAGMYWCVDLFFDSALWRDDNVQDIEHIESFVRSPIYFDGEMVQRRDKYIKDFLEYYNPYTGMTIGDDPAFAFVSMYNETTFFMINSFAEWDYYYPILKKKYNDWLCDKYKTREALFAAWKSESETTIGLKDNEDPIKGTVDCYGYADRKKCNSKRAKDNIEFIGYIEELNYKSGLEVVRNCGCKALFNGSTTFLSGTDDAAAVYENLNAGDFIGYQIYQYLSSNGQNIRTGTALRKPPASAMESSQAGIIGYIANIRPYGRPYLITEWNGVMPNCYASETLLLMAAYSRLQNWNPFLFCWGGSYSELRYKDPVDKAIVNSLVLYYDPVKQAALPNAALMTVGKDVSEADAGYYPKRFKENDMFEKNNQSFSPDAWLALVGKTGAAYDRISYNSDYNNNDVLNLANEGKRTGIYKSVTGELCIDTNQSSFTVDTKGTQATAGFFDGKTVELSDVSFTLDNKFATVYLSSLTDEPISDSSRMLLTLTGNYRNAGMTMDQEGIEIINPGTGPIIVEQIKGEILIKNKDNYEVYALASTGQRKKRITTDKTAEGYTKIITSYTDEAMNYEILRVANNVSVKADDRVEAKPVATDIFNDIEDEQLDKKAERLYMQGIVRATAENKFSPKKSITRAEFSAILVDALGFITDKAADFSDVDNKHFLYSQISAAKEFGIITGDGTGIFRPDDELTRYDMAIMTERALSAKGWTAEKYKNLYNEYIRIKASESATRGDACSLVYNILWK